MKSLLPVATILAFSLVGSLTACGPSYIPGTQIEDTPANKQVLTLLQEYKSGMESRNAAAIIKLCSSRYFEDNGNADANDDYGYGDLRDRILPDTFKRLSEVQLEVEVREIRVDKDRANADVRFSYRAKMALPSGDKWNVDTQLNRLQLAREGNDWKIISGL